MCRGEESDAIGAGPRAIDLPGPARRIVVEPIVLPAPVRPAERPAPKPAEAPAAPEPVPTPEREREPAPSEGARP